MGLPSLVFRQMSRPIPIRTKHGLEESNLASSNAFAGDWDIAGAQYINLASTMCDAQGCLVYLGENVEQGISSMDHIHLSAIASDYFAKTVLVPQILKAVQQSK